MYRMKNGTDPDKLHTDTVQLRWPYKDMLCVRRWSDAGPAGRVRSGGNYNAESPKEGSKRFNWLVRRNTLPIQVWYLSKSTRVQADIKNAIGGCSFKCTLWHHVYFQRVTPSCGRGSGTTASGSTVPTTTSWRPSSRGRASTGHSPSTPSLQVSVYRLHTFTVQ